MRLSKVHKRLLGRSLTFIFRAQVDFRVVESVPKKRYKRQVEKKLIICRHICTLFDNQLAQKTSQTNVESIVID